VQFITNGPDVPDALLQAHEEGRVVFFCGAGISYPAGLPGFSGLVDRLYQALSITPNLVQQSAIKAGQFDTAIGLLEGDVVGGRGMVRTELATILTPNLSAPNATATHEALLTLAQNREGRTRLITTNFDRLFEEVRAAKSLLFPDFKAPLLPVPKTRWDGLVYLHGLLPITATAGDLDRLVVSSGDFGLAYLTERWAARFVSELFRNFTVCFVGYSINDPVLRYMMDALAADRLLGESPPEMFAFGSYSKSKEVDRASEWKAKNVTPILYREHRHHAYLHKTLRAWANTYRDGVRGKERIVVEYAIARPLASTKQDDFVGRMLWALSDKSGLPAKQFAEFNPVPSLDWLLEAFSDRRFTFGDLLRFDVPPRINVDNELRFSLIRRPAPYDRAPSMALVDGGAAGSQWDNTMFHLARWLLRHLNDPRLVIWIAQHGGHLNNRWALMVENALNEFADREHNGRTVELDEIRSQAPNAIPTPLMRNLWRLLLSDRVKLRSRDSTIYRWLGKLKREGLTATLRLELRDLLSPRVALSKPFPWSVEDGEADEPTRLRQLVDWELVLAGDDVHTALRDLGGEHWISALPNLLQDFQQLLRDALDLLRELGEADDRNDRSHWDLPSIAQHWQNRGFREWVILIEMLRDAWSAVLSGSNGSQATSLALTWFGLPYPTFKRLALFAASQDDRITSSQWVDWLLADGTWWLWSTDTQREVLRLIVLKGRQLGGADQERLEAAILAGPPRKMYREDLDPERWKNLLAHSIWLHLAKLNSSGLVLGDSAAAKLTQLSTTNPEWRLATDERDEFSHWMSGTGDPDFEESRNTDIAPRKRRDLVQWLKKPLPEQRPLYEDKWRDVCRTHFMNSLYALCDLAREGVWPTERWREALQTWSEERMISRSWRYAAPVVGALPDAVIQEIIHAVTWWMEATSKAIDGHEGILLDLCRRVLALPLEADTGITRNGEPIGQPVTEAINHPVGHVTQALINLWLKRGPNDNDLLSPDIAPLLTQICDVQVDRFRHGRVLLASHLIALFRVDRPWTERCLLPLFAWGSSAEARALWEGFLWSPRLYQPLLIAFKPQLLETANHYVELGEHRQQFAAFLTYAALGPTQGYSVEEFRSAIGALPPEGLERSAQALTQALEGAAGQREDYWRNRLLPFWQQIWPKSRELASPRIAESLTRLVIAARDEFPSALDAVQHWLQPVAYPHYVIGLLHKSGLCRQHPACALRLLNIIVSDQQWLSQELGQCLNEIILTAPNLALDTQYLRLQEASRRWGG